MQAILPHPPAPVILRLPDLIKYIRLSRSTIYQMVADGQMPAPIKLGPRASGWLKLDIDRWLSERAMARAGK